MALEVIKGKQAAGYQPVWIIPAGDITTVNAENPTIPLTAITGNGVKIDCHYNLGGIELNREATTTERQRACQKMAETVKTGETVSGSLTAIMDQQADPSDAINKAYSALPEGEEFWLFVAHGWDSEKEPISKTKGDLYKLTATQVHKPFATSNEEEITFVATLNGSAFYADVALSG